MDDFSLKAYHRISLGKVVRGQETGEVLQYYV